MAIKRQTQSRRKSASTTRARAGRGARLALPTSVLQVSGTLRPPISTRKRPGPLSLAEKINLLKSIGLPGPGTVYVTLNRMEDKGYVESWQEDRATGAVGLPRRLYKVTGLGSTVLKEWSQLARRLTLAMQGGTL